MNDPIPNRMPSLTNPMGQYPSGSSPHMMNESNAHLYNSAQRLAIQYPQFMNSNAQGTNSLLQPLLQNSGSQAPTANTPYMVSGTAQRQKLTTSNFFYNT